jgi:hypothetical protein
VAPVRSPTRSTTISPPVPAGEVISALSSVVRRTAVAPVNRRHSTSPVSLSRKETCRLSGEVTTSTRAASTSAMSPTGWSSPVVHAVDVPVSGYRRTCPRAST